MPRLRPAQRPGSPLPGSEMPERSNPAVAVVAVLAALLILVVGLGLWHLRRDTIEAQARALASLATASSDELERGLQGVKLAMQVTRDELREGRIVPGRPDASAQLHTRSMILSRTRRLWVVDAQGRVLAASGLTPPPRPADFLPTPLRLADEGIAFSVPFADPERGERSVALAVRYGSRWPEGAAADDRASGWVVAEVPAASLLGSFPRAALSPDARMVVQRADGVVLAGTLRQTAQSPEPTIDDNLDADAVQRLSDGSLRVVQVRHMASLDLRIIMTRDLGAGLQNWRELAQGSGIALVVVLGALGALLARMLRAERARQVLSVKLARVRKLESLGTLAGGVAHDFNNILAAVQGYGEMARQAAKPGSDQARHIDRVLQAARQGQAAVGRILGFSRSGSRPRTRVAVQPLVEQVLDLLAGTMDARIRVERRIGPFEGPAGGQGPQVLGDATPLFQAVMNLCTNGLQAMQGQPGVLTVGLQQRCFAGTHWTSHGSLAPGDYAEISVADTGVGIAPEVMDRLFEPFFTTRGREGTGLGLAVVHGVVEDFGGGVDVASRPGQGSRFSLYLPLAPAGEATLPADAADTEPNMAASDDLSAQAPGRGQCVMVVDDEEALVTLAEEMLARSGYEPVGFTDPQRALEAFRAEPGRFDLLLTDERMPRLSGTQLIEEVRRLRPTLPVLLVSGWGGPQLAQRAAALGVRQVLAKPIDPQALVAAVTAACRVGHDDIAAGTSRDDAHPH